MNESTNSLKMLPYCKISEIVGFTTIIIIINIIIIIIIIII